MILYGVWCMVICGTVHNIVEKVEWKGRILSERRWCRRNIIKKRTKVRIMNSTRDLRRLLYERTEALRRRDDTIDALEKALEERDATIHYLQNEIDKFRQIVDVSLASVKNGSNQRLKRQAISAEPLIRCDMKPVMKFIKPKR